MFVTCFCAILEPENGRLVYANAGHNLPYWRHDERATTGLEARGMPLGLMPGMSYEEEESRAAKPELLRHLLLTHGTPNWGLSCFIKRFLHDVGRISLGSPPASQSCWSPEASRSSLA
jgi:hypothetical protein